MANVSTFPTTAGGPAQVVVPITVNDTTALNFKAVLCSTDMTLKITDLSGNVVTGVPFVKGYNPIGVQVVWSTGSTLNGGTLFGLR